METLLAEYVLLGLAVVGGLWVAHLAIEHYREREVLRLAALQDKHIEQIARRVLGEYLERTASETQQALGYPSLSYQEVSEALLGYRTPSSPGPQALARHGSVKPGPLPTKE